MTKTHSHYESLNVTRDAPPEVIRAAYRSLSQKHHPDKNIGNQDAAHMMARLNAAYSVLSDSDQRELYDLQMLSEQRAREMNYAFQDSVDFGSSTAVYTEFTMDETARSSRPAAAKAGGPPTSRVDALLRLLHNYAKGRRIKIAVTMLGIFGLAIALVLWFIWKDNQSMLRLEQAAVYGADAVGSPAAERPEQTETQAKAAAKSKSSGVGVIQISGPSGLDAGTAELAAPAAAPKAPAAPSAAAKASEYERLTAMLKSMGLGLHKLDLPTQASSARPAAAPVKPAEAVEAARTSSAPPAAQAARSAAAPDTSRAREETARPAAPDPARSETKAVAEASRASAPPAASTNPASAGRTARAAVIVDASACAPPKYPTNAYLSGESGTVVLALLVGGDGKVMESKVQKSSGSSELDKAARKALSQCKFKPADSQAEPTWATLSYVWSLD